MLSRSVELLSLVGISARESGFWRQNGPLLKRVSEAGSTLCQSVPSLLRERSQLPGFTFPLDSIRSRLVSGVETWAPKVYAAPEALRAPVAQLDSASVFGTEGCRFESYRAYCLLVQISIFGHILKQDS